MKRLLLLLGLLQLLFCMPLAAQTWAVKSNLLYDATLSANAGVEFRVGEKMTIDVSADYNAWQWNDNRKMKHIMVQPELRWWTCERFNGSFFGVHAHYAFYNWGGMLPWGFRTGKMFGSIDNPQIRSHRFQGWLAGAGLSYGYHWILSPRWGLEATLGVGYAYLEYEKYQCENCGLKEANENKHYLGPTKAGITLIYMIK